MTILSLQAMLLYWLHQALLGDCEEEWGSFTIFSQVNSPQADLLGCYEPTISFLTRSIWQNIPLQKKQNVAAVLYISAMPQRLLSKNDSTLSLTLLKSIEKPFSAISQQTVSQLKKNRSQTINSERDHNGSDRTLLFQLWAEFQIETQRPGWISFRLSDRGICLWLDQLQRLVDNDNLTFSEALSTAAATPAIASFPTASLPIASPETEQMLWQVQYTHARCCSLLRLWQQIQLAVAVPVLGCPAFGLTQLLGMTPSVSATLIHGLIETVDDLFWIPYRWPAQQYFLLLKRAVQLCQSFEAFYSARLSGFGQLSAAVSTASSEACDRELIAELQAGFYLAIATKNILKVLLCRYLGAEAPVEL
jgi:hypothetical protein